MPPHPKPSALSFSHSQSQARNIFSLSLNKKDKSTTIDPAPAAACGGMLQTPYTSSHSVSSSEDSPSPRTPAISDSASCVSPRPTPSPNIEGLSLKASSNGNDAAITASDPERLSPESKPENNAPVRHPEVVLTMQQPEQQNIPQQAQPNASKGGCWTCRIRRKKCDEQRTGDSCQTCIRLRIDCLGWGPKRPAWMRDKQAVEAYKAGIKEKLIKAGMVRGQPRLTQGGASRSTTLPSGSSQQSSSPAQAYSQTHAPAHRSMSGPAAFGGLGGMGSIGPIGALGVMGGSMTSSSISFELNQQHYSQQQHLQPQGVRYGPYPSPRSLQGFQSPHLAAQQASHIPQASTVMGAEFDYLGIPDQIEHGQLQQQHINRRPSFGFSSSHQRNAQQLERRRHSLAYSSSPSLTGGSPSSQGNSPYITGHGSIGGPFGASTSTQGPHTSLVDFTGDVFGNLGSGIGGGGLTDVSPAMSGLAVPDMNSIAGVPGVSNSPSMIAGDDSLLFPGSGAYAAPQSRSSSISASASVAASGPSRPNSSPSAGYADPLTDPALVEPHIQYYFDSVMPMQYAFASERARNILQNLFTREPYGALVNASCALAAKHNKTIRVARLLDPPDADPQQSTAQQFFNRAYWQLTNTTTRASDAGAAMPSTGYTASDALASLHLVAYFLLQGGMGDWQMHLDMAREWLSLTGLCASENKAPRETLALMGDAEQLATKMIIWYDVVAAISLHQSPRFLETYRRLFGSTISRDANEQSAQTTNMSYFFGCPEDVLLILAETAALAQWKAQERQLGTLSNRELLRRGDAIENRLLVSSIAEGTAPLHSATSLMRLTYTSGEHRVPSPTASTVQHKQESTVIPVVEATGASHASGTSTSSTSFDPLMASVAGVPGSSSVGNSAANLFSTDDGKNVPERKYQAHTYQRVTQAFLHTASLYLASVINEPSPNIPEISNAVNAIVDDLASLSDVAVDRMLALPIALAGCMTDQLEQRHFLRSRLTALDEVIGNVRSVRILMERVWRVRDTHGGVVDWRDIIQNDFRVELLLV